MSGGTQMPAGGEMAGGAPSGGMAAMMPMPMETPIDERCPDAQAGEHLLVLFKDRVDAYRIRDFSVDYLCTFLDLAGNGITQATGMAISRDEPRKILIVQPEDMNGSVYEFDLSGTFVKKTDTNINLGGIKGIWNTFGDDFIAWSARSSNFYTISADGAYQGAATLPAGAPNLVRNVTDLTYLDQNSLIVTFNNRPPQLFRAPFNPKFLEEDVGAANAINTVATAEGDKILMTAQIGGPDGAYGVALYKPVTNGRMAPELERVIVAGTDGDIEDGVGIIAKDVGFWVLDSGLGGAARITAFDDGGGVQATVNVEGGGNPLTFFKARIFPDF